MLSSLIWILLAGYFAGQVAYRFRVPALVGRVLAGIGLGPQVANLLDADMLASADSFRAIAVMVILMKAGLGLDRDKLAQQGTVALRLGFLPAACEAIVVALAAVWLFQFSWATGLLLGCVLGAESPAVIVPGMLRLKSLGWGVKKGIPDAILTGSALSDVLLLLVFSLLLAFLSQGARPALPGGIELNPLLLLPLQVVLQIGLGVALGWLTARLLVCVLTRRRWTQNTVQETLVAASWALLLVVVAERVPVFSGYLAVMAAGFFLIERDLPLARQLRRGFNSLWIVAEILLFVLLGASIQLDVLGHVLWVGLGVLALGTLVGRSLGWYLATLGSNWTRSERMFLLAGNSAKATVQAAIGAIPLAQGIEGGETILALAALSILVTAPLGAWAIPAFAPRLLARDAVDPAKVLVDAKVQLLAVVDRAISPRVLVKAAELARRCDGSIVVLPISLTAANLASLQPQIRQHLADIRYRVLATATEASEVVQIAQDARVDEIVIGKGADEAGKVSAIARMILNYSSIPVVVVE
ncbi:MAG: cation:proton antiporter [Cyanobacteria bacterium J06627_15]